MLASLQHVRDRTLSAQVIDAHGEDFDEMNVTTCFHELAKIAKDKSKEEMEEMHVHDTFQTLAGEFYCLPCEHKVNDGAVDCTEAST